MKIGDQLRLAREHLSLSQEEFAEKINIPKTAISKYERGIVKPAADILTKISETYNINLNWLLLGTGNMLKTSEPSPTHGNYIEIPLVQGKIAAGCGLIPDCAVETYLSFRSDWIRQKGSPETMSLIRVSGDSMENTLSHGDVVLVDHSRNYLDSSGMYAISIDDHSMVKRLTPMGDKIQIVSDNTKYPPFILPVDEVTINGKVIWYAHEIKN